MIPKKTTAFVFDAGRTVSPPLVATFTGTGADAEVAALHAALVAGAAAFARPMTIDQFDAAYKAINDASYAFSGRCREIANWVQRKRPMG